MSEQRPITIAVPTRNRPAFLRRLLRYYAQCDVKFPLVIADSSGPAARAENEATVAAMRRDLDIALEHPGGHFVTHCCTALRAVKTPYVIFCADDDFIVPDSLPACVEFLSGHPEHTAVLGSSIVIETGQRSDCWLTTGYDLEQEDAAVRFRKMTRQSFPVFYAAYRTHQLLEWFELADRHTDYTKGALFSEIMCMQLAVVVGKVRCIAALQNLRQMHAANESIVYRAIKDEASCEEQYVDIRDCLAEKLVLGSRGLSLEEAGRLVDRQMGAMRHGLRAWKAAGRGHLGRRLWKNTGFRLQRVLGGAEGRSCILHRKLRRSDVQSQDPHFATIERLVREYPEGIPADAAEASAA